MEEDSVVEEYTSDTPPKLVLATKGVE